MIGEFFHPGCFDRIKDNYIRQRIRLVNLQGIYISTKFNVAHAIEREDLGLMKILTIIQRVGA